MELKIKHEIDNNIFQTNITVESLGTEQLSEDEEADLLSDFPTKIAYRNLTFTKNVTMSGKAPVVTTDEVGESVVSVTLPTLSNKEILIDKDFAASYKIDSGKIVASAIDEAVLTTKELVAQAYCAVFDAVICDALRVEMAAIREKAPAFAKEDLINI